MENKYLHNMQEVIETNIYVIIYSQNKKHKNAVNNKQHKILGYTDSLTNSA